MEEVGPHNLQNGSVLNSTVTIPAESTEFPKNQWADAEVSLKDPESEPNVEEKFRENVAPASSNPPIDDESVNPELLLLQTCAEIGLQIIQLNDDLLTSIVEEQTLLDNLLATTKKIKERPFKCKLLEIGDLVQLFRKYLVNWNNLWRDDVKENTTVIRPNRRRLSYLSHLRDFVDELTDTLRASAVTFLQRLDRLFRIGIRILSLQGVLQEVPASTIQRCIAGIVDYQALAYELGNNDRYSETPDITSHEQFRSLPDAGSGRVDEMLRLIATERGRRFAKVMLDLLDVGLTQLSPDFQRVTGRGWWPLLLPPPGHPDSWPPPRTQPRVSSTRVVTNQVGGSTSDYCSGDSGNVNGYREVSDNGETTIGSKMTDHCMALQTMYSQEELNVSKLVFVIRLSFLEDVGDSVNRCGPTQVGVAAVERGSKGGQSGRMMLAEPRHARIYWEELERRTLDHLLAGLDGVDCGSVRRRGRNSNRMVGDGGTAIVALTPGHLVELANVVEEICEILEKQIPLVRVYHHLKCHFHLLAVKKAWDQSFCQMLSAISNPKGTVALLTNDSCRTTTGKCVTDCLQFILGIELLASTKPDFAVESIHSATFPLLLVTLQLTTTWLEANIKLALSQWHIGKFGYITQGDLKKTVDLLKHVESVNPAQRSSLFFPSTSPSSRLQMLRDRESTCHRLCVWDDVRASVSRLQNNSSTCMKDFCKAGGTKTQNAVSTLMPLGKVWQQSCRRKGIPTACNPYARTLVEEVMVPVVEGVTRLPVPAQIGIVTMATKVFIEAWMAHILSKRIRFSLHGGHLLRLDFQHLMDFLHQQQTLSPETRQSVQSLEVMRQLRGAAALLLHQTEPQSHFGLVRVSRRVSPMGDDQTLGSTDSEEAIQAEGADGSDYESGIADEEYVSDRAAWLALRVRNGQRRSFAPFWCFA